MPTAIFEAVLGNLAMAAALAVVAWAVGRWAKCPAVAHTLWLLVLVKLLTPPLFTIPVRCLPAKTEPPTAAVAPTPPASAASPATPELSPVVIVEPAPVAAPPSPRPAVAPAAVAVEPTPTTAAAVPASPPVRAARWVPSWEVVLLGVWVAGAALSLGLVVQRARRFGRLLKFASAAPAGLVEEVAVAAIAMGLRRVPRVRVVPGGIAPLVWALGRPTLYFPAGLLARLSTEQRLALVAHELAHLRRWDHVVRLIEFAAVAIFWWCPLAWLARRELRRLEEEACDAEVVTTVPGSGYAYASAILETIDYIAGVAPAPALASGIGDAGSLRRRLELILKTPPAAGTSRRARLVLLVAGIALLAVGPKLARLTASVVDVALGSPAESPTRTAGVPVPPDEVFVEPTQFLPTPDRFLDPGEVGASPAHAASLSPNGARLAVAVGPTVTVYDLATKQPVFTLVGHTESINAVVFSPDGSRIATVGNDTVGIIWDATDGRRLHTLTGHGRWVLSAAFSPDGTTLATGGYDKTIRLWDAITGAPKATWTGHTGGVRTVAFSPDGRTLATGGADHEVRLWDVARGVTTHTLKKHTAAIRVVTFSPDGTRLASGSEDRTVQVWAAADGRAIGQPVPLPDSVTALAFSRRGQALYAGTFGGHLLNINPPTGSARGYVGVEPGRPAGNPAHADGVVAILTPPDGTALYTVSQDGVAFAWRSAGPPQTPRLVFRNGHPMSAVALSPDGALLATAGLDGMIHLWDAATARELMTLPGHPGGVAALVFGANGRLVSAGADERVRVWDTASGRVTYTVIQATADLSIALSPDGRTLAIGGRKSQGITLVNLATGGKPRRIGEFAGEVTALAFTPAGDRVASGYANGLFRMWDANTGEEVVRGPAGTGSVDGIAFNPTGTVAAVVLNGAPRADGETESGPTHEVAFLETRDGSVLDTSRSLAHPGPITAAAFTADGHVLTAAHDGNLYLWNFRTAQVVRTIRGHIDAVRGVALTTDGTAVFSTGGRAAKKWPLMNPEKK
jgi:WD40 repeat protein/beta-lactamase regulating signal transducer with metallopeptidase domain